MDLAPYIASHELNRHAGMGGSPEPKASPAQRLTTRLIQDDAARATRVARHAQDLARVAQAIVDLDAGRPVRPC